MYDDDDFFVYLSDSQTQLWTVFQFFWYSFSATQSHDVQISIFSLTFDNDLVINLKITVSSSKHRKKNITENSKYMLCFTRTRKYRREFLSRAHIQQFDHNVVESRNKNTEEERFPRFIFSAQDRTFEKWNIFISHASRFVREKQQRDSG